MKLVSTKVVCSRYGRSDRTIDRWIESGELPQPIYIRGLRYWDEEDLNQRDEARKAGAVAATTDKNQGPRV